MDKFINVNKKDPQAQIKLRDMLEKNNRLPYIYQSKIGSDTLIQNVILMELLNLMGATIVDMDIELKFKSSKIKKLENK